MAKYGTFKYGEQKYGAMQTTAFKVSSSLSQTNGIAYLKDIVLKAKAGLMHTISIHKNVTLRARALFTLARRISKSVHINISASLSSLKGTDKAATFDVKSNSMVSKRAEKNIIARVSTVYTIGKQISKITAFVIKILSKMFWYKSLYPHLEFIEYLINMEYIGYVVSMEVVGMPYAGSTITLKGTFPDSAGNLTQLQNVSLKVYAPSRVLDETITPAEASTGVYMGDYTIPTDITGQFDYEFSGELGDRTVVGRSSFQSIWR